jgi:hypothetical protein
MKQLKSVIATPYFTNKYLRLVVASIVVVDVDVEPTIVVANEQLQPALDQTNATKF